jgi:hypothetical protein
MKAEGGRLNLLVPIFTLPLLHGTLAFGDRRRDGRVELTLSPSFPED